MKNVIPFLIGLVVILCCYNLRSQALVQKYNANGFAKAKYSPNKEILAIANKKNIQLYTAGTGTLIREIILNKPVTALEFSVDGSKLLVGGWGNEVQIIDINTSDVVRKIKVDDRFIILDQTEVKQIEMIDLNHAALIYKEVLQVIEIETGEIKVHKDFGQPLKAMSVDFRSGDIFAAGKEKNIYKINSHFPDSLSVIRHTDKWISSLDVSPDGKWLAVGNYNSLATIIELSTGEVVKTFSELEGRVTDVEFSGDSKYLVLSSEKGDCKVYSMEKGILGLNIKRAGKPLISASFNLNGKEMATVDKYQKVKTWDVSTLNISPVFRFKDDKDNTPPQIFVSNPPNIKDDRYRYSQDIIRITGAVMDESGIRQLRINGMTTPIRDNGNFVINLPLQMGDNFVTIEAVDVNDNTALKKFVVNRKDLDGEDYDPSKAKNYLFVVGVNDYDHWPKLFNAVRDANDVATTLMGAYNFQFDDVIMLKNEQATRSNIYNSLRSLISKVGPKDNLIIYYSGHGHFDELLNEGYWIPVDAKLNTPSDYLSNSDILKVIGSINSQHTFLVADACFSGSLFAEQTRGYVENVEKYRSRWGLASGRLETVSDGGQGANSPFATNFIHFLKTTDKKSFAVSELVQYVKVKVAEVSDQTPLGNPLKGAGDEGGEFVFYKNY